MRACLGWCWRAAGLWGLVVLGLGCDRLIGDACVTGQECATGAICDTAAPGGYCTQTPCFTNGCPDEAVCVEFEDRTTYCMLRCEADGDCRDGYTCRDDVGPAKFCYIQ
jgi:hypothetical protein